MFFCLHVTILCKMLHAPCYALPLNEVGMLSSYVQVAMQQADYVAWNIWASIDKRPLLPFKYQRLGTMMSFGRSSAAVKLNLPLPSRVCLQASIPVQQWQLLLLHYTCCVISFSKCGLCYFLISTGYCLDVESQIIRSICRGEGCATVVFCQGFMMGSFMQIWAQLFRAVHWVDFSRVQG